MGLFDSLPALFTGALGDPVSYTPVGGSAAAIKAIIEWDALIVAPFDGPGTNCTRVVAHLRSEDAGAAPEGGHLTTAANAWLGATTWKMVQPITRDGKGMTTVTLEKTT